MPPRKSKTPQEMAGLWERIDRIASEIGRYPDQAMSVADAIREERE
ncbi:MAG: hypothetical protein HY675_08655 [Chloroflexi bacterium]|nr:hypothetical protein [Chloroflexota bacterium]